MATSLVPTAGLAAIASRLKDATTAAFTYMALGTGTVNPVAGNTALGTEITTLGGARVNVAAGNITLGGTGSIQWKNTFTFTGTLAITELGILNASSAGTLLCRSVWTPATNVDADTSVEFTALLTFASA